MGWEEEEAVDGFGGVHVRLFVRKVLFVTFLELGRDDDVLLLLSSVIHNGPIKGFAVHCVLRLVLHEGIRSPNLGS